MILTRAMKMTMVKCEYLERNMFETARTDREVDQQLELTQLSVTT